MEYNFGLTCVDAEGSTTRHLFGVNSFDPEETFDTLVECKLCLGLDGDDAAKNVTALTKDVQALQGEMKEIQADVATIMKELDLKTTAPTEAPADFLHQKRHHKKKPASHAARKAEIRRHHSHKKAKHHVDIDEDDDSLEGELSDADLSID